jgi:hypothetical protein
MVQAARADIQVDEAGEFATDAAKCAANADDSSNVSSISQPRGAL